MNDSVYNNGNSAANSVRADLLALPSGISKVSGADPQTLGTINARTAKPAGWMLKAKKKGTFTISVTVSGSNVPSTTKSVVVVAN